MLVYISTDCMSDLDGFNFIAASICEASKFFLFFRLNITRNKKMRFFRK